VLDVPAEEDGASYMMKYLLQVQREQQTVAFNTNLLFMSHPDKFEGKKTTQA